MDTGTYSGNCPAAVADAVTNILRESLLLIRVAGNADDADFCAVEANHVHHLPSLLRNYQRAKLERYLAWARSGYLPEFQTRFQRLPTMFLPEWQRLDAYLRETETAERVVLVNGTNGRTPQAASGTGGAVGSDAF